MSFEARNPLSVNRPLRTNEPAHLTLHYASDYEKEIPMMWARIGVLDGLGNSILSVGTTQTIRWFSHLPPHGTLTCKMDRLPLLPGQYKLSLALKTDYGPSGVADVLEGYVQLHISSEWEFPEDVIDKKHGSIYVPAEWSQAQ